jgi:hypothetical protein
MTTLDPASIKFNGNIRNDQTAFDVSSANLMSVPTEESVADGLDTIKAPNNSQFCEALIVEDFQQVNQETETLAVHSRNPDIVWVAVGARESRGTAYSR